MAWIYQTRVYRLPIIEAAAAPNSAPTSSHPAIGEQDADPIFPAFLKDWVLPALLGYTDQRTTSLCQLDYITRDARRSQATPLRELTVFNHARTLHIPRERQLDRLWRH